jgi:DNA polymerase-1
MPAAARLFLIDGYALIYRAFFAMLSRPLTTSRGENTSAAWGVANFLMRLVEKHRPAYVAWVHDAGTSFRHEEFPEYKATREKLDAELQQDFDRSVTRIESLLEAFRVRLVSVDGFEADDVIATLAERAAATGLEVVIVSGDKDFYQLIGPRVRLLNPGRGGPAAVEELLVTEANAHERLGVRPELTVDYLALVGDSADNVPGVRGVGEKTAQKLLDQYGSLDAILAHAGEIEAKRVRESLQQDAERARLSRRLVTLRRDVPVDVDLDSLAAREPAWGDLLPIFSELEFHSLVRALDERAATAPAPAAAASAYGIVDTPAAVAEVVRRVREAGGCAIHGETAGGDPMRGDLVGLAIAVAPGEGWYAPLGHRASGDMLEQAEVRNLPPLAAGALGPLAALLGDASMRKTGHDLKADWLALRRAGIELKGVEFDSMIASFMVDPGKRSHALDALVLEHFNVPLRPLEEVVGKGRTGRSLAEVSVREAADYCCATADYSLRLRARLEPTLADHHLAPLFRDVEIPLIGVLVDMEWRASRSTGSISRASRPRCAASWRGSRARSTRRRAATST